MITRVRIEGEAPTPEMLQGEFDWLCRHIEDVFHTYGVAITPGHSILERCVGEADVSVHGNWKGRMIAHTDTSKLNAQLEGLSARRTA